jgi:hypothetical protein
MQSPLPEGTYFCGGFCATRNGKFADITRQAASDPWGTRGVKH